MDRRAFLTAKLRSFKKPAESTTSFQTQSGITPYTGTWGTPEIVHLLKRTMFGANRTDINYFKSKTMSQMVDELLNPTAPLPPPPNKDYGYAELQDNNIAEGTTWVYDNNPDNVVQAYRRESFRRWWSAIMIVQDRSIREKMTLFWHNHFATSTKVVEDPQIIYKHHELLRKSALGNFAYLVRDVTIDPCMLIYLSGVSNTITRPNENYAREMQELFMLGKENNPNYTEDDVKEAARVLTGWSISPNDFTTAVFNVSQHDIGDKKFSAFFDNTVVKGRSSDSAGHEELVDLLLMILRKKKEVSEFIVRKLYRFFCYYTIDANTEANVIAPLAKIFQDSNWEIKPVLSALFKSEHFYDAVNRGCLIKSPADMVVGLAHDFNINFIDAGGSYKDANAMCNYIFLQLAEMRQELGAPPNVAGWPAYYMQPLYHRIWINSETITKRQKFFDDMISVNYQTTDNKTIKMDPIGFAKQLSNPGDPNKLLDDSLEVLFTTSFSSETKLSIKQQFILTNQQSDYYWTNAWNKMLSTPDDMATYQIVYSRLLNLYKYLINLPEYQLS